MRMRADTQVTGQADPDGGMVPVGPEECPPALCPVENPGFRLGLVRVAPSPEAGPTDQTSGPIFNPYWEKLIERSYSRFIQFTRPEGALNSPFGPVLIYLRPEKVGFDKAAESDPHCFDFDYAAGQRGAGGANELFFGRGSMVRFRPSRACGPSEQN